jgi:hypothetical protein
MEVHFLLHFRMGDGEKFVASIERDGLNPYHDFGQVRHNGTVGIGTLVPSDHSGLLGWRHASMCVRNAGGNQQAVFVDLVKLMETPERIIPSLIWFEGVERFYCILPKNLYFSTNVGRHVFRGTPDDWELNSRLSFAGPRKSKGDVVEGTPKIVQNVANDVGNVEGNVRDAGDIITALSRVRIILDSKSSIRCAVEKGPDCGFQVLDVLFRPFDF